MKQIFLGNTKYVVLESDEKIGFDLVEYPLSIVVTASVRDPRLSFARMRSALRSALSVSRWKSRLARIHSALVNFVPTETQLRHWTDWLIRASETAETVIKLVVIAWVVYLVIEVVLAFTPGGPAHRLLGGGQ